MSYLRPGAAVALRRWAETAVAAGLAGLGFWLGLRLAGQGALIGWLALAGAALALFWLRAAFLGALAQRGADGAGLVVIREGEIGYLGPWRGGLLELDRLVRVEIYRPAPGHDPVWRLIGSDGTTLAIPADAEGAEHLPEALAALPGFSDLAAVSVLRRTGAGRHLVWQRETGRLSAP